MDNPEGDPFADLDAEMNAIGESPPDVEMPVPAEIPAPLPVAIPPQDSLFNYGEAPSAPKILLQSKYGDSLEIPPTEKINDDISTCEFSACAMEFNRHGSPVGLKYAQWFVGLEGRVC